MVIDSTTGSTAARTESASTVPVSALGQDAFMGLLVAQLQNQNPLQPQADGEFLAQLAQFSSLEQLQGIRQDMARLVSLFNEALAAQVTTGEGEA